MTERVPGTSSRLRIDAGHSYFKIQTSSAKISVRMDLRDAVKNLVDEAKNIEQWLRVEGDTLSRVDLILEVQL